jgi:hypothetical protein
MTDVGDDGDASSWAKSISSMPVVELLPTPPLGLVTMTTREEATMMYSSLLARF